MHSFINLINFSIKIIRFEKFLFDIEVNESDSLWFGVFVNNISNKSNLKKSVGALLVPKSMW